MEAILIDRVFTSFKDFRDICISDHIDVSNIPYLNNNEAELDLNNSAFYPYILYTLWNNETEVIGGLKCCCINNYSLTDFPDNKSLYTRCITYLTVNPKYQRQGYSSKIFRGFCEFLNLVEIKDEIYLSPYTKLGFQYLKKNLFKIAKKYDIKLIDSYCFEN